MGERRQQDAIDYLKEENRVLRERIGEGPLRLTDEQRIRLANKGRAVGRKGLKDIAGIVAPDTILRWFRELVAKKYDGTKKRGPGRPKKEAEIAKLVVRMATGNSGWGYTKIRDALHNLGIEIGRNTVKRILLENGIEPAPERRKRTSWKTFLKAHGNHIVGADFFTIEVLSLRGLVRYYVFFVIELSSRRVHLAGITRQPCEAWMAALGRPGLRVTWTSCPMMQIARNLTDAVDGFLTGKTYIILDRDPLYTAAFRRLLKDSGVKPLRLPARSPNLNAQAERWILSIKSECLARVIPLGENHLRSVVGAYVDHYHVERVHQGLNHRLIEPDERAGRTAGPVACRERVGGLLRYYYRKAA